MAVPAEPTTAGKSYAFRKADRTAPADHWFQKSTDGEILFVVMYTQACMYSRCTGCNLPSVMSREHVPFTDLMKQVDHVFDRLLDPLRAERIGKIILSNNGSVLDERTFSTTALLYFVARMNERCRNLAVLCLESRAEFVDEIELSVLARALKEGETPTTLEIAIGFEAFDDRIRNKVFRKGLSPAAFERTVAMAAKHGFRTKAYFMLKPVPGMSDDEAVADIESGVRYLDSVASKYNAEINMHLNPTYVSRGTSLETAFREGRYAPPTLDMLRRAARAAEGTRVSLYLGLYDEGLAVEGGSFLREGDGPLVERLEKFNRTADYSLLAGEDR